VISSRHRRGRRFHADCRPVTVAIDLRRRPRPRHHPLVLVVDGVAVIDEAPTITASVKGMTTFSTPDLPRWPAARRRCPAGRPRSPHAVHLGDQERGLVDMEAVVLVVGVDDRPFLVSPSLTVWSTRLSSMTRPQIMKTFRSAVREYSSVRRRAIGLERTSSIHAAGEALAQDLALRLRLGAPSRRTRPSPAAGSAPVLSSLRSGMEWCAWRIRRVAGRSRSRRSAHRAEEELGQLARSR